MGNWQMANVNTEHWTALQDLVDGSDKAHSSIQDIAVCEDSLPAGTQRLWMVTVYGKDRYVTAPTTDGGRNPTIGELTKSAGNLQTAKGYLYVCRDETPDADGTYPLAVYKPPAAGSAAAALTITRTDGTVEPTAFESCNTDRASDTSNKEVTTGLTDAEIAYIQEKFLANHQDISSIQIGCRNNNIRGLTTLSITRSITVLGPIIGRTGLLEGSASTPDSISYDIEHPERLPASLGATPVERLATAMKVKTELEKILATNPNVQTQIGRREADEDRERTDDKQTVMVAVFLLMAYQALRQIWNDGKAFVNWWRFGRIKTTDFRAFVQKLLKKNNNYEVVGRMDEAREAWRQADTEGFRGVIVNLPTGEGKDEFAKAMIILKEREALNIGNARANSVVPEEFRNAPVWRINAAEFQENTNLRGQVADKLSDIIKKARRGPVIYIISEIDQVFKAGGSSSGDSEKVANLLLNILEDEVIRHNLMLIGTTSRGDDMLTQHPDLERRFNWPDLHTYLLNEIEGIIFKGPTRTIYETRYGVQISPDVVNAATRLAVKYYRSPFWNLRVALGRNIPRFDAIKKVLEDAAKLAKREGTTNVTVDQVRRATEARYRVTISQEAMDSLLRVTNMNSLDPNRYEVRGMEPSPFEQPQCVMDAQDSTTAAAAKANIFTDLLKNDPELRLLTIGLSNADVAEYGRWLNAEWTALSVGERAIYMSAPGSYKMWVVEMSKVLQGGAMAERVEAERAEDKEKKDKLKIDKMGKTLFDPAKGAKGIHK